MEKQDIKKVLILRLSALGDTIHTLPIVYALKKTYPDCKIGWVVEDKAALFIKNNPLVDNCYVLPKKEWKKRGFFSLQNIKEFKNIIDEINAEGYDVVLDTQQLFKSASLLPFLKIKRKVTLTGGREFYQLFSNEIYKESHKLFDPDYHIVNRNLEFAKALGADVSESKIVLADSTDAVKQKVDSLLHTLSSDRKTVVISPATTWVNKHWDENNWCETVKHFANKVNIVFTGMEQDKALISRILKDTGCDNAIILAGQTNLEELAEVFRRADVVISPDSGSVHIAWAVSKPAVISIFTATAENRTAPFGQNCYVLAPELECRPCLKRKCKRKSNQNECCSLVKADALIELVEKILQ